LTGEAAAADREAKDQVLVVNNERISIPEVLFNPADIGEPRRPLRTALSAPALVRACGAQACTRLAWPSWLLSPSRRAHRCARLRPRGAASVRELFDSRVDRRGPQETHGLLYENILVVGGSAMFPGFKDRL
jgi:actin-related protein